MIALLLLLVSAQSPIAHAITPPLPKQPCAKNRVLFVSDSHGMGPFFQRLEDWAVALPETEVHTYNLGGSNPVWFIESVRKQYGAITSPWAYHYNSCAGQPRVHRSTIHPGKSSVTAQDIRDLVGSVPRTAYGQETIVIEEGFNMWGTVEQRAKWVAEFLKPIVAREGSRCFWIGPPQPPGNEKASPGTWAKINAAYDGVIAGIKLAGGGCTLIDSRSISRYPSTDNDIHYLFSKNGTTAGIAWAEAVIAQIMEKITAAAP